MRLSNRLFVLLPGVVLCAAVAMGDTAPTSVFQLNGYAGSPTLNTCSYSTGTNPQLCDNWNLLNGTGNSNNPPGGPGANSSPGHSTLRDFFNGSVQNFLFKGGTKDIQDVSAWAYSPNQKAPPKDTFNAVYAANYIGPSDQHEVLIFGGDRAAPNGDANIGAWLLQRAIKPEANGTFSCGLAAGLPCHVNHDIFITSAFTNGGVAPYVTVMEWNTSCASAGVTKPPYSSGQIGTCIAPNLKLLASETAGALCGATILCGVINSATTNSSWEGNLVSPLFFTGGVDLTAALAVGGVTSAPCFASFELETRSSQDPNAEMKDFVLGAFPTCSDAITKACDTSVQPTVVFYNSTGATCTPGNAGCTAYTHFVFKGSVINDGGGTIFQPTVTDTFPQGAVHTSLTQPTANSVPGGCASPYTACSVPYSGSFEVAGVTGPVTNHVTLAAAGTDGGDKTVTLDHNGAPAAADASDFFTGACTPPSFNPKLKITKSCTVGLSPTSSGVVLVLNDTITVCNQSTDTNDNISNINVINNVHNIPTSGTNTDYSVDTGQVLTPGQCIQYAPAGTSVPTGYLSETLAPYVPVSCDGGPPSLTGGRCEFSDQGRIDQTGANAPKDPLGNAVPSSSIISPTAVVTCHVCPDGACTINGTP